MKKLLALLALVFVVSCAHKSTPSPAVARDVASTTCDSVFQPAIDSGMTGQVYEAAEICEEAVRSACVAYVENNSDGPGTGDGRYVGAICRLKAAHGANKAVTGKKASPKCEAAHKKAKDSPRNSDVMSATEVCEADLDKACAKKGGSTGDGRYIGAVCQLTGNHGAYQAVKNLK